ncbi:phage tail protein [Salinicola rhizosphaerae]|uniref:Tail assembly protein n=1 Tax=Salinicola rhizosphaerae TaxID=1443141 RepID=A0ABQ3EDJ9_9GAMM|nr:phage tail protein [Salinicola rhizosphaerae]GHB32967.1 tail assembly protein [Salinicola rhizosphaerae]
MMMVYGMFVFSLSTAAYQDFRRQTQWRNSSLSRIGKRPAIQFLGPGTDRITLAGELYPEFTGGQANLDQLRAMGEQGAAWPLIEGTGRMYGLFTMDSMDEGSDRHFRDGAASHITFSLSLSRIDDDQRERLGTISGAALRAVTGAPS